MADILCAGVQLSVGKSARAALSKLDVGVEVQRPRLEKSLHVFLSLFHWLATLQQDGPQARPGQQQCGEQARRSRAHHHGRKRRQRPRLRESIGGGGDITGYFRIAAAAQELLILLRLHRHGVNQLRVLPSVHAAAQDVDTFNFVLADAQNAGGFPHQLSQAPSGPLFQSFYFQQTFLLPFIFF
ncbi:hypothetical protein SDC9_123160 [bioreactor metagenome]|uniref:Uncharacterized protein n=1 Tax=bioreactor metagenome TaxID=1076179 RepID=A0A645CH05_9ZZZZ